MKVKGTTAFFAGVRTLTSACLDTYELKTLENKKLVNDLFSYKYTSTSTNSFGFDLQINLKVNFEKLRVKAKRFLAPTGAQGEVMS